MNELLTDWLTNKVWKTDRLPDCLTNGPNWLSNWLTYRPSLTNWLNAWQTDRTDWLTTWQWTKLIIWLTGLLSYLLTEWLTNIAVLRFLMNLWKTDCLSDWLANWRANWLADWQIVRFTGWHLAWMTEWLIGEILLTDWLCGFKVKALFFSTRFGPKLRFSVGRVPWFATRNVCRIVWNILTAWGKNYAWVFIRLPVANKIADA